MPCARPEDLGRFSSMAADERGAILDHAATCADCRAALAVLLPDAPTARVRRIDRYTLGRVLGRGAMGIVYAARDPDLDRDVALKVLRPDASAERLHREAQALAKLKHPNVVHVYDVGDDAGQIFIAMELVDGANLRQWLTTPRTVAEILAVLVRAGHGLVAAHTVGIVHRDFKPDNVFVAASGNVLVGDFGLACAADAAMVSALLASSALVTASLTATGAVVGTPAYMAPELVHGEATPAADQFAFCVTAWEALYGMRPFAGGTLGELHANARAHLLVLPAEHAVPRRIERILRRGLAADPSERFPSLSDLLAALQPTPRRWPLLVGVVGATALAAGAWTVTRPRAEACSIADWSSSTTIADPIAAALFGQRIATWRSARADACRAARERDVDTTCLERTRATLSVLAIALPHDGATIAAADHDRCAPLPETPGARLIDEQLTLADALLAADDPALVESSIRAARALGDPDVSLRADLLAARHAAWLGDPTTAIALLRTVSERAEHAANDPLRAQALVELATQLVARAPTEAARLVASARAVGERAGVELELPLTRVEALLAMARDDERAAVVHQQRVIALLVARDQRPTSEQQMEQRMLSLLDKTPQDSVELAAFAASLEARGDAPRCLVAYRALGSELGIARCLRGLGRYRDALAQLKGMHEPRELGIVAAEAGEWRLARTTLAALPLPADAYARAEQRFALAQALWADGGLDDRHRARELAQAAADELDTVSRAATRAGARSRDLRAALVSWIERTP